MFNLEDTGSAGAEKIDGDIAQLGERLPCKQEVAGSIPTISTNFELKMDGSGQEVVRFDLVSSETGNCTLKTEQCIKVMKARQQRGLSRRLERKVVNF